MFEFLNSFDENDAMNLLKQDHDKVKELFEEFQKADTLREKKRIAAEAIKELKIHATIEEEIFYPCMRPGLEKMIVNEADEEHHVAKLLIAELEQMEATDDHFEAKFKVLSENIRHHIREEEGQMFPKARGLEIDFIAIGLQLQARKAELKKNGVPECAEERLMARHGRNADSPAATAAHKTKTGTTRGKKVISLKSHAAAGRKKAAAAKQKNHGARRSRKTAR